MPVGSERAPDAPPAPAAESATAAESRTSGENEGDDTEEEKAPEYHLPALNAAINDALRKYGAVFPKLNLTAPKDSAFLLQTSSGPLTSLRASDVYLFLKSSNFIHHDLDPERLYEGCADFPSTGGAGAAEDSAPRKEELPLELVLRKYVNGLNPAMEFRCFVRDGVLVGISQRDSNFYDHLQDPTVQQGLRQGIREFFEDEVAENPPTVHSSSASGAPSGSNSFVFDVYVDSKGSLGYGYALENGDRVVLMDFQPYRASTDSLMFSYADVRDVLVRSRSGSEDAEQLPVLRVIDSANHPEANRNQPTFSTNMMPIEMVELSEGRNLEEFREVWAQAVAAGMVDPADLPLGQPGPSSAGQ